jgi:hypothetical protein
MKTQVVYVGNGRQGFDFLGFHCRKLESWKYRGNRYLQQWPGRRAIEAPSAHAAANVSASSLSRTRASSSA